MELTPTTLAANTPGVILRDATLHGLHARGHRLFLYYRAHDGTERRPKLGEYPTMSLAQARTLARDLLLRVAAGEDPGAQRVAARVAPTVKMLIDRYETECAPRRKAGAATVRLLRTHVQPRLGGTKAAIVDYAAVQALHGALKRTPFQANRVVAAMSRLFALAERWGARPPGSNPCRGIEFYPEPKRRRFLQPDEAARLGAVFRDAEARNPQAVAFLRLLILTGARCAEIAAARPEWIQGTVLRLPDAKTGARDIYLSPAALEVIASLPRRATLTGIRSPAKLWRRLRVLAGCPDLRLHDLRHSFASAALQAGLSLPQIGELLGHASAQTSKRYAHLANASAQSGVARTADVLSAMLGV